MAELKLQGDTLYSELLVRPGGIPTVLLNSLLPLIYKEEYFVKDLYRPFVCLTADRSVYDDLVAITVANLLDLGVVPGIAYLAGSAKASELFVDKVKAFYDKIPNKDSKFVDVTPTTIRVSNSSYVTAYDDTPRGMSETMVIALEPLDQEVLSGVLCPVMMMKNATVWISKENTEKAFKELPEELWVEWKM